MNINKKIFGGIFLFELLTILLSIVYFRLFFILHIILGIGLIIFSSKIGVVCFQWAKKFNENIRIAASKLFGFELENTLFSFSLFPYSHSKAFSIWGIRLLGAWLIVIFSLGLYFIFSN
jgi:hypothetical protein